MSTATLPVELLIEIFELAMTNVGPEAGVSQLASQSRKMANASGQAALTESSNEDSGDEDSDDVDVDEDSDDDDQKWDEGYTCSSSDDESEDSGDWEISVEPIQGKEGEEQRTNAPGVLEMRRPRDGAVKWSTLKACRL